MRVVSIGDAICPHGAVLEEELHNVRVAILRCLPQRCLVASMHICAVLKKELNNSYMTILRCSPQRVIVVSVYVCTVLEEERNNV